VMSEMGYAMMGSGVASGEDRAEEAAEMAISSPLLEDIDLSGARGVLVNITLNVYRGQLMQRKVNSCDSDYHYGNKKYKRNMLHFDDRM